MKRLALLAFVIFVALSAACSAPATINTAIGEFEVGQEVMDKIEDEQGSSLAAADGNTLLVVYVTPAKGTDVTEDVVQSYFNGGTQAVIGNERYDLKCMAFEKTGGKLRYGLVFEVPDLGYESKKPDFQLSIPQSAPTPKASPEGTPAPSVSASTEPLATTTPETSPTESTDASS